MHNLIKFSIYRLSKIKSLKTYTAYLQLFPTRNRTTIFEEILNYTEVRTEESFFMKKKFIKN